MAGAGNPNAVQHSGNRGADVRLPQQPAGLTAQGGMGVTSTATPSVQTGAAPGAPNIYDQSAGALTGAIGATNDAMQGPQIDQFMNPYTSAVTDRTMQDLERQRLMQTNNIGAQASAAGAFGGSRHGVAEALTNEGFARQGADTFANLNMQGFNTALDAAQRQQGIGLQGAGLLGDLSRTGFGMGQEINQQQMQQGGLQQGLMQMLMDAARQQYAGFTGAPQNAVELPLAAVGGANMGQGTTTGETTQQPGLFNYLSLGASFL